ncbi:Prolipoprotein diacylglyceryl transferase [Minicystis rosea]|nr:Prolipoprotein diacylglyceryl transferase [Minicystis rosea]
MAPLIPYIQVPELPIPFLADVLSHLPGIGRSFDPSHPPTIKPFGTLVAFGVYIGSVLAMRHGRQRGIEEKKLSEFIFWVVGLGFVGAHVLDAIFYHPAQVMKNPAYLFALWEGLSSYGGFIGAALGALLWRWRKQQSVLAMVEVINSAFPLAWVFGRMGCATVHDHPGMLSDAWFAVRWPMPHGGIAGRLDLGLIEMVLTIPLAIAFLVLWRRNPFRPLGFYTGWMCVAYAPVRFVLDFLRVSESEPGVGNGGDPRYAGLTPAQWACFGLLAMGIYFVRLSQRGEPSGPPAPVSDEGEDEEEDDGEEARPTEKAPAENP